MNDFPLLRVCWFAQGFTARARLIDKSVDSLCAVGGGNKQGNKSRVEEERGRRVFYGRFMAQVLCLYDF